MSSGCSACRPEIYIHTYIDIYIQIHIHIHITADGGERGDVCRVAAAPAGLGVSLLARRRVRARPGDGDRDARACVRACVRTIRNAAVADLF